MVGMCLRGPKILPNLFSTLSPHFVQSRRHRPRLQVQDDRCHLLMLYHIGNLRISHFHELPRSIPVLNGDPSHVHVKGSVSNRQDLTFQQPRNGDIRQGRMSQLDDPDADALAALTFLERHDDNVHNAPVPAVSSTSSPDSSPPSPPSRPREEPPSIVEPDMQPPSPESENASVYKSSFAPSRNAMQRKARSEAQQAAHEAATHRPGRGTAKAKNKPKRGGAWGDSSEEEEEDEEEEDEDVDSDGQPANLRDDRSVSNYAASPNQRSRFSAHHVGRHRSPVVAIHRLNNHSRVRRGTCLLSLFSADKVCYLHGLFCMP